MSEERVLIAKFSVKAYSDGSVDLCTHEDERVSRSVDDPDQRRSDNLYGVAFELVESIFVWPSTAREMYRRVKGGKK